MKLVIISVLILSVYTTISCSRVIKFGSKIAVYNKTSTKIALVYPEEVDGYDPFVLENGFIITESTKSRPYDGDAICLSPNPSGGKPHPGGTSNNLNEAEPKNKCMRSNFGGCDCVYDGFECYRDKQLVYDKTMDKVVWENVGSITLLSNEFMLPNEPANISEALSNTIGLEHDVLPSYIEAIPLSSRSTIYLHGRLGIHSEPSPMFSKEETSLEFVDGDFKIGEHYLDLRILGVSPYYVTISFTKFPNRFFSVYQNTGSLIHYNRGFGYILAIDASDFARIKLKKLAWDLEKLAPYKSSSPVIYVDMLRHNFYAADAEGRKSVLPLAGANCVTCIDLPNCVNGTNCTNCIRGEHIKLHVEKEDGGYEATILSLDYSSAGIPPFYCLEGLDISMNGTYISASDGQRYELLSMDEEELLVLKRSHQDFE